MARELYFQQYMTYADVEQLDAYVPTEGVTVTITYRDSRGFGATASHAALAAVTCGFFTGTVPDGTVAPALDPGSSVRD